MIRKKAWRYYCEYCKKRGGSGGHIKKHEKHCTLNPNRECGMCELRGESPYKMSDLLNCLPDPEPFKWIDEYGFCSYPGLNKSVEEAMPALRRLVGECPACIMAALRQKGIPVPVVESFNYKKECEIWLSGANEENRECYY